MLKEAMLFNPQSIEDKKKNFCDVKARKETHEKWVAEHLGFQVGELVYCQQALTAPKIFKDYNNDLGEEICISKKNDAPTGFITVKKKDLFIYTGFEVLLSWREIPMLCVTFLYKGVVYGTTPQKEERRIKTLMEKEGTYGQLINRKYGFVVVGHNDVETVDRFILKEYFDNHFRKVKE